MQVEMSIKGIMVDPTTNMPIVLLHDAERQKVIPICVGIFEANAIASQIENASPSRPMTHDLLREVIHALRAQVKKIVVNEINDSTFYAFIHLNIDGEQIAIDARPSDAIALALRAKAPIFVEEEVIDNVKSIDPAPDKADSERLQRWLEELDPDELGKYKM